ncbi:MAG: hypothetical protein WA948_07305 [Pontixanthobacter sp.]
MTTDGGRGWAAMDRLTDDTGIVQHSRFAVLDRNHGYCIDDNARALMLVAIADDLPAEVCVRYGLIYAAFVQHGWNDTTGAFRNFMGWDRRWLEDTGSLDSNGRTLWALATAETRFPDKGVRDWAATLFDQVVRRVDPETSPRTAAFLILAMEQNASARGDNAIAPTLVARCGKYLHGLFEHHAAPGWQWFEPYLSYDNYRLPEALIAAGTLLDRSQWIETGCEALSWLIARQTGPSGVFRPVATEEFGVIHAPPALYDQQPIEAWAAIDAAIAVQRARPDKRWIDHAEAAFAWFTGTNDARSPIANSAIGECFDGIGAQGVNRNMGAESVLAWQFAQRRIEVLRRLDIC